MADNDTVNERVTAPISTKRSCDGCDLCCTLIAVHSLNKGPGVRCAHLRGEPGTSCSIYDSRPDDCRGFMCLWRRSDDVLPDWIAPASAGFVISLDGNFEKRPIVFTVHVDPTRPDAWMATRNVKVFKNLARQFNGMVVVGQGHLAQHLFAPSGKEFTREKSPEIFADRGRKVHFPNSEFLTDMREGDNKDPDNT